MDDKQPIPVPPSQRWREFRIQLLPLVVFLVITFAVASLWKQVVIPVSLVGEVASVQYQVRSLIEGTITDLKVEPFSYVQKGEEIGHVAVMDPATLQAEIDVARTELNLLQLRTGVSVDQARLRLGQLTLNRDSVQSSLSVAKVDFENKKAIFDRTKLLYEGNLASKAVFDVAATDLESAKARIAGYETQMASYESQIRTLGDTAPEASGITASLSEALQARQRQLELVGKPIALKAPADGIVGQILFRAGEKVRAGEPVAIISATNTTHILGYLRQPLAYVPQVDDEVQVRSRATKRVIAPAKILKVGGELTFMNPALISPDSNRTEKALPILVSMPAGLNLKPGEFVDLWVARK